MIYVADESVAGPIIERLRADGLTVLSIRELAPGITDDEVLARANSVQAVLLTEDKDFGELVWQHGAVHPGVVLIRLSGLSGEQRAETVSQFICDHAAELAGAFSVVSAGGIRIRTKPSASP
jgi:predicted nuclease of predicted toxin-antitoxin system